MGLQKLARVFHANYVLAASACNGNKTPETRMIAAGSDSIWNNGAACGRSYIVCTGSTNK